MFFEGGRVRQAGACGQGGCVRFGRNETEKTEKTEKLLIHKALRFPFFIPFSVPFSVFPFVGVIGGGFYAVRVLNG